MKEKIKKVFKDAEPVGGNAGPKYPKSPTRKCYNCKNEFNEAKYGRSHGIEIMLLITTWWLLWIPLFLYCGFTPKWICPICGAKQMKQ